MFIIGYDNSVQHCDWRVLYSFATIIYHNHFSRIRGLYQFFRIFVTKYYIDTSIKNSSNSYIFPLVHFTLCQLKYLNLPKYNNLYVYTFLSSLLSAPYTIVLQFFLPPIFPILLLEHADGEESSTCCTLISSTSDVAVGCFPKRSVCRRFAAVTLRNDGQEDKVSVRLFCLTSCCLYIIQNCLFSIFIICLSLTRCTYLAAIFYSEVGEVLARFRTHLRTRENMLRSYTISEMPHNNL